MENRALGLIETYGFVGAVEAADTAVKAAFVTLLGIEKIKGGLVTVQITGDVGAVKAAVDAAVMKTEEMGSYRSSHVIPRLDDSIWSMISEAPKTENVEPGKVEPGKIEVEINIPAEETTEKVVMPKHFASMKVVALRNHVRKLENFPIPNKKIKFANKQQLMDALREYYQKKDDSEK